MMRNNTVEAKMGTWGMVLKPNRSYRVVFDQPFHLKMAVLNFSGFTQQEYSFSLMLLDNSDDRVPLTVCILNKQKFQQSQLDVEFEKDDDVTFFVKTETFTKDTNNFSVHLSGKTTRDPEVFSKRPTTLVLNRDELRLKSRSGSLPDEYYDKRGLSSPKNVPSPLTSPVRHSATSPAISAQPDETPVTGTETIEDEPPKSPKSPKTKEPRDKTRGSFKGGEVFGKLGKFLSKS